MNGLANLAWAVMCIAGAAPFLVVVITDHAEIGRRLRTWACRERSPGQAHPASRAVRGWERISDKEDRECAALELMWNVPAVADSERLTPRGDS